MQPFIYKFSQTNSRRTFSTTKKERQSNPLSLVVMNYQTLFIAFENEIISTFFIFDRAYRADSHKTSISNIPQTTYPAVTAICS